MGRIAATCLGTKKGERKHEVEGVRMIAGSGVEGDGHAGGERQVSLLALESVEAARAEYGSRTGDPTTSPGCFAENLLTEGIDWPACEIGDRIRVGAEVVLEINRLGRIFLLGDYLVSCLVFRGIKLGRRIPCERLIVVAPVLENIRSTLFSLFEDSVNNRLDW